MAQSTPRKQHIVTDKCALCSFSFCNIEITSSGETFKNTTYLNRKLKLTVEKIEDLKVILGVRDFVPTETGICIKCYRKVESVKKTEKELQKTKQTIFDSFLLSSSNREVVVKRLAESPSKGVKKVFSPSIMHRTKLNTSEMQSKQTFKRSNTLQLIEDCPCILPCDVKPSVIPLVCT
ncbi:uncharacterized protein LOC128551661, partial [Mercenaria mercenaria]|uniref:uncharacterized protein LOC128551661 n=1 Tax=Mercenaria mercenaria TaxID=6596 RepID=UPI00234FB26A